MPVVLTLAAALAAIGDWVAVRWRSRPAEYVLKPLVLALLLAAAVELRDQAPTMRWAFVVAALALSLVGDILLMLPGDLFLGGLAAFLVGHLAYVASFNILPPPPAALALGAVVVAAAAVPLYLRLRRGMEERGERNLAGPVAVYVAAIGVMVASALATVGRPDWVASRSALAVVGAGLFMTSDALIGWNRFVRPLPWAPVAVMVTYHLAQGALVWALLGWAGARA